MSMTYTYTTLKAALTSFCDDDGSEFVAQLDNIIGLGEQRLLRDLDLELFDDTASSTFTASSPWLAKPTDIIAVRTMHYKSGNNWVLLDPKTWEYAQDYWPNDATTTASPKFYVDFSDTSWYIAGTPAGNYPVRIRYIVRPDGLSGTTAQTWLSKYAGDALLMACLVESEGFLKADERIATWKQNYMERVQGVRKEVRSVDRMDYKPLGGK